jgi:hypothetical protein
LWKSEAHNGQIGELSWKSEGRAISDPRQEVVMSEEKVPKKMQVAYEAIVALTDEVCHDHLNEEYAQLSRKLAAALSRKRPSPLASGRSRSWACGIVYALGQVNFLFDRSQTPYVSAQDLVALFGVSQQTAGNKAKQIRDLLNISQLDWAWMLPSRRDEAPMAWMISVNGFIVDARHIPREIQEIAFEKGLIPYVPGEVKDDKEGP